MSHFRTAIVCFSAILAIVIPSFGLFLALVGAFANSVVMFVLPPWIYYGACKKNNLPISNLTKVGLGLLIALGSIACIAGTSSALKALITLDSNAC